MPPIGRLKTKRQDFFQKKRIRQPDAQVKKISSYVGIIQIRLRVKAFAYSQPARASSPVSFNLLYSLCLFPSRKNCCPKTTVFLFPLFRQMLPHNIGIALQQIALQTLCKRRFFSTLHVLQIFSAAQQCRTRSVHQIRRRARCILLRHEQH